LLHWEDLMAGFACLFEDVNADGTRQDREPSSTSDGQGRYSFEIPLGSFPSGSSQSVNLPKNSAPVTPVTSSRKMTARADDPTGNDFGNWRPASVIGTVVSDDNGDRARDSGEGGLAGIAVFAGLDGNRREKGTG
jgi:hypothetical protein